MDRQTEGRTLRDYLAVLRRRAWLIVAVTGIAVAVALLYSLHQTSIYRASVNVYIKNKSLVVSPTGSVSPVTNASAADRLLQTQAILARTTKVTKRALGPWGSGYGKPATGASAKYASVTTLTPQGLLKVSTVSPDPTADFLNFQAQSTNPDMAVRLANGYAAAYVVTRNSEDVGQFVGAQKQTQDAIDSLSPAERKGSFALTNLQEQMAQYKLYASLAADNASITQPATSATKIQPKPVKAAFIGGILGLVLGTVLAFVATSLDTRLKSGDDTAAILGLPLLARIPAPSRKLARQGPLVMLSDTPGVDAEPYRKLRTNLEFANLRPQATVIMVTSAVPREGKTTTACNLAVAAARAGQRVILVDLDLRKPMVAEFLHLNRPLGVTDVALHHVPLLEALIEIDTAPGATNGHGPSSNGSGGQAGGMLGVLTAGTLPLEPAEFMSSPELADTIAQLAERADLVLIDSAPMLAVSDSMALARLVEGIVVVARANVVRSSMLEEMRRLLETLPCAKLGFVLTNAEHQKGYGYGGDHAYGYGYGYGESRAPANGAHSAPAEARSPDA